MAPVIPNSQRVCRKFHHDGAASTTTSCGTRSIMRNDCGVCQNPPLRTRQMPVTRTSLFSGMDSSLSATTPGGSGRIEKYIAALEHEPEAVRLRLAVQ